MSGGRRVDTEPSVVGRTLAILDSFTRDRPVLRLVEISHRTGLPGPTVLRLVRQLCECGAMERTPDLGYRIGPRLGRLAELGDDRLRSDA